MNEKIKSIFMGKRKVENLIILVILLIIIVVAINYIFGGTSINNNNEQANIKNNVVEVTTNNTETDIEAKLENILSKIEGVGKVKVMITYSKSTTIEPVYNENYKLSNTTESDNDGGTRTISEENNQKEVIYKEKNDGTKEPITQSILSPVIEGAIIAAQGAANDDIKSDIIQAVEAATGLASHKIQVFKMEDQK